MVDVVPAHVRSKMMAGIRGKNTKPELILRKALFSRGFRYRLHDVRLPGKPDLVFPSRRSVIFVNGCFWHGHTCSLFKWPSSNADFWRRKIERNAELDRKWREDLSRSHWRVLYVWECSLKGRHKIPFSALVDRVERWLDRGPRYLEIRGSERHNTIQ